MSIEEGKANWLACAIDTEGCIRLSAFTNPRRRRKHLEYKPIVTIVNTNMDFLNFARSLIGGGYIFQNKDKRSSRKVCWILSIPHRNLESILNAIKPHLIIKRRQCDLLLEALAILKANRAFRKGGLLEENFKRLGEIKDELSVLNKRGR
jgi:hypothetical protein